MKLPHAFPSALALSGLMTTGFLPGQQQQPAPKAAAYQSSVSQEQLRLETRRQEMEILELLGQLGQYQFTKTEHGELKDVLTQLDGVAENEMPAIVRKLREASRQEQQEQAKTRLVDASSAQKNLQSQLRSMADRLMLQKDEATIQQRLRTLTLRQKANQRDTERLSKLDSRPENIPAEHSSLLALNKAEQNALRDEIKLLRDSLNRLANGASSSRESFRDALNTANGRGLENLPKEAVDRLSRNLNEASRLESNIHEGLLAVIESLNSKKPKDEQLKALAEEIKEISTQQERIAQSTPKADSADQQSLRKEQEKLSDKMEMAKKALDQLNRDAAKQTAKIQESSDALASKLDTADLLNKAENVAATADTQNDIAKKLDAVSESLLEQARQLAENDASQPEKQALALAEKLQSLAKDEEKLAEATANAPAAEQEPLKQRQEALAAQVEAAQQAVEKLSPEAGEKTKHASEKSNKAEKMLSQQGFLDTPENKPKVTDTQKDVAQDLNSASQALEKKAQELAEARANQPSPADAAEKAAALAQTMQSLATQQENLAKSSENQATQQQQQSALAEQIKAAQAEAEKLNSEAAAQSAQASQEAQSASETLKQDSALSNAESKSKLAQTQQNAAEKLQNASQLLQAQAQAAAESQLDAKEAALAHAMNQVMNARSQIELAQRQMEQGAAAPEVGERVAKAQESFAQAAKTTEGIGAPVPSSVGEALKEGQQNLEEADTGLKENTAPKQPATDLAEAHQNADQALAGLQEAASQLAAQKAQQQGQQMAQNGPPKQPGQEPGAPGEPTPGPAGGESKSKKENTDFSAISKLRGGQRDALDLLKQEKVSPEYEAQVQQYIRNLADGQVPTP